MSKKSINPYDLLGVTIESTSKECRKKYYKLSLLCHPDKGGSKNDMVILHNAYRYVMKQLEYKETSKTQEEVEEDFKSYFRHSMEKPPSFYEIWCDTDEAKNLSRFNLKFEQESRYDGPFSSGYGAMMIDPDTTAMGHMIDDVLKRFKKLPLEVVNIVDQYLYGVLEHFNEAIVEYTEPMAYGDDSSCFKTDTNGNVTVTDFTRYDKGSLGGADYMKTMSNTSIKVGGGFEKRATSFEQLLKERHDFDENMANNPQFGNPRGDLARELFPLP